jgi:serine/threonine-protein kinase Chk1
VSDSEVIVTMVEFIEEWFIEQTLGEGAFGDVKLLVNRRTKAEVALKLVDMKEHPDAGDVVAKEIQIHKMLIHDNIIRFYGSRREGHTEYLFLEYASGGELFDRIEPDVGMDPLIAQSYFQQLICGVDYLHSLGIAHRDLKPENILLDGKGTLKISDFGFATVFRTRGVERLLEKRCGTLPYVAPEVLHKQYKAVPADIWSCGVILVALLAGELPWDRPCIDCPEYKTWKDEQKMAQHQMPWKKLELAALNFVKRILCSQPSKRLTIEQMQNHPWLTKRPSSAGGIRMSGVTPMNKKMTSGTALNSSVDDSLTRLFSYSQPEPCLSDDAQEVFHNQQLLQMIFLLDLN